MPENSCTQSFRTVGQLVDVQWQVGVATSSSECHSLNSPYVILSLKIGDSNGSVSTKTMEMSIGEFRKFHSQLKEMSSAMSTV